MNLGLTRQKKVSSVAQEFSDKSQNSKVSNSKYSPQAVCL